MFKKFRMISILAVVLCVALWLGSAMAEEQNTFATVTNGTLNQDGVYTGSYYYRVDLSSVPDDIEIGMGFGPIDGNKPYDQDFRVVPVSNLEGTSGHRFLLSFPDKRVENPTDAFFMKMDVRDNEWTKLVFAYDMTKTNAPKATVTSTAIPALNEDYEIKWSAVSGVDIYGVHWKAANGEEYVASVEGNRTSVMLSELAERGRYEDYRDMTRFPGVCEAWIDVYKDGEIGEGTHKSFTIAAQVNGQDERHIYLTSDRQETTQDGKTYYAARVHEDVWFTVMADEYVRGRMKDLIFVNGDRSERLSAWDMNQVGRVDSKWVPESEISGSKDYTVYAAALIQGEEGEFWVYSDLKTVRVSMTEPLAGTLSFSGPDLPTSKPFAAEHPIAQDESLVLWVNYNKKDANDNVPDFYGCKIDEENGDTIADSQWVTAESEGSTEVRMPMFRTEVGKTYQATVYAVKMGGPTIEAADPITVTTGSRKGNQPIILQMKDEYETDERIRIYGYYDNANKLNEDNSWIHLRVYKKGSNDSIFDMEGDGFYLWEDHLRINEPGTYVAEAVILQDFGNWQPNEASETKTTFEFSVSGNNGQLSAPTITLGTTQAELGQLIPITISGSAYGTGNESVAAERYTFRVYKYEGDDEIDYDNVLRESFTNGAGTMHIDTRLLGNGRYRVEVEATARGYTPESASASFTVRKKPELSITSHTATDGVYSIPVHSDFTVRINAEGADHVELDLDRGWDRGPIFLEEFEEWWNGAWGENHEDIELTLQYDESCDNVEGSDTFPMTVRANYWFDGKDDAPIVSDSLTVVSTRNGQVNTENWDPVKYWKTRDNGDVDLSWWKENDSWQTVTASGITIARGKLLHIYLGTAEDERPEGWPEGCYTDFSGFLLPNTNDWNPYDMGGPDEFGWLTLSTAGIGDLESNTEISAWLRLYTWKNGWDSNYKDTALTITNTKVEEGANWLFYGADAQGNVTVQTHEGISFNVYVPGASSLEVFAYNQHGDEVLSGGWDRDYLSWEDWRMDSEAELTFKAVAEFADQNGNASKTTYTYPGMVEIKSQGPLPAPTVTLTGETNTVRKGQNAGFTVTENSAVFQSGTSGAYKDEYKDIWYNAYLWDEEWHNIDHIDDLKLTETHSFSFGTGNLQEGKFYHITVDIQQVGWTGAASEAVFAVVSNKEGLQTKTITLKVDGTELENGSTINLPSSKKTRVEVEAPNATAVRVLNGNRSEFWYGNDDFQREWSFGNDTLLAAMATYDPLPENFDKDGWDWEKWDWDSLNWTGVSNTVAVHVTNAGEMPEPIYHLEKKNGGTWENVSAENLSIPQGTELRVVYHTSGEGAMEFPDDINGNYWGFINIGRQEWDRWGSWWNWANDNWNWDGENSRIVIPTVVYEPGHYMLRVGIDAVGWNGQTDEIEFNITENESPVPATLVLSRDEMLVGDNVNIYAYAPNAEWMEVEILWDRDANWNDRRNGGGESRIWDWGCGCSGEYTFTLHAYRGNEEFTDTQTLTVKRNGILENPDISGVPSVIGMGTGINGSFTAVEGAQNYNVQLRFMPEDRDEDERVYEDNRNPADDDATALVLSGEQLSRAGLYKLTVSADSYGLEHGYSEQEIRVLPGKQDGEATHTIVLKVNGGVPDNNILEWPSSKNLKVKVEVPQGAAKPTAIRILNGDWWEYWYGNDNYEREWGFGNDTDLVAMATYTALPAGFDQDGWDWRYWDWNTDVAWTAVSNIVHLNIINDGDMPEPEFDLKIKQANGWTPVNTGNLCVPRGTEMQIVYRMSGENAIQFPENFGDTDYWGFVNIEQQEGNEWGTWWNGTNYDWHWDRRSSSITIETIVYEPGRYRMRVGLDAEGWRGNDKEFEFDISDNAELPDAVLMLDKKTMVVGDQLGIYAYAPGAEHLRLDVSWVQDGRPIENWQWSSDADGEYGDWNWGTSEHGEYTFKLGVFYPKNSGKQDREIVQELTVATISETILLPEIKIKNIPIVNRTGDSINGSFDIIEKEGVQYATPDSYRIMLNYWPDFGEGEEIYNVERKPGDAGLTTLAFNADLVSRPGMYFLQVNAEKYGYDHGYDELNFIVLPKSPEQATLTLKVNGDTADVNDWKLFMPLDDVNVVTPEGVTAVRIWKRNHFEYFAGDRGYNECDWSFEAGNWTMVAQATTDEQVTTWLDEHGNLDQFDWNKVDWSLTSNSLMVKVVKTGNLVDPTVKYGEDAWPDSGVTIERGNALTFTIGTVANCDYCGIKVRKAGDWWEWLVDTDLQYTETATVSIPTDGFGAGDYQLAIDPRRYGYEGHEKYYAFTITEPTNWEAKQARFTVSKTDALTREAVTFSIYAPGAERVKLCYASPNNVWREEEGELLVGNVQMNWVRDYNVYAYALYPDDDDWTQIGNEATIVHVTAPNGTLNITNVNAPESNKASENLNVTMSCSFGASNGYFECWLTDVNNQDYELYSVEENTVNGVTTETFRIDGGTLQPGIYILAGYAFPDKTGWRMGTFERTITVTADDETAEDLQLQLGTITAKTGDDVGIMGYAKNANHVKVEVIFPDGVAEHDWADQIFEENGDTVMDSAFMGEIACTVTVKLTATYASGDPRTLTKTITVEAPKGTLNPAIRLNRAWTAGSGLDFTVDIGKNDTQYVVKVREKGLVDTLLFDFQRGNREKDYYVQPTNFVPGKIYEIEVIAAGSGYGRGVTTLTLRCRKAAPMTMTLPGGLKTIETEAFEGVIAEKIIVPAGVTTIGSKAFANCKRLMEIELPEGITSISADAFSGCETIFVYSKKGSDLEGYADQCENLEFVEVR